MDLNTILVLCGVAIIVGQLNNLNWKRYAILIINILVLFALQPKLPIRNLDFWLPTSTILICIMSWISVREKSQKNIKEILFPILTIVSIYSILFILKQISVFPSSIFSIPNNNQNILFAIIFFSLTIIAYRLHVRKPSFWLMTILLIFILLKTPQLANLISIGLRSMTNQSISAAKSLDISWIGFSYIAFRIIQTLRDHISGRLPKVDLVDYINFVAFFPTLSAGPIDRIERYQNSFANSIKPLEGRILVGGKRIVLGLFKKFVIANILSMFALNAMNATQILTTGWMWISLYAYAFLIYFDFSGYTDIAIGMGYLMGIKVPENFTKPYLKSNLTLFWNSWHITLTQFFRAYFFNPLTRSIRTGKRKWPVWLIIIVSQISTMVLIGLWHGIIINFVLWGLWHGLGLFIQNRWSTSLGVKVEEKFRGTIPEKIIRGTSLFLTFNFIALGWVFFALPKVDISLIVFKKLFGVG